ncbi:MAG: ribosome recycling factor [Cytophagales bacterium]|nr:ribosome recycling factor [Bernardetiaceae bacterium]MDW8205271.1 ribosome recycling factor [Cytophagales bacterium]
MEEINMYLQEAAEQMEKAVKHIQHEFTKIRAGKATPSMLDGLYVNYYGANSPIGQVANVTTTDARTIVIKPWEKSMLAEIEKAIKNSDLGVNPTNDGEVVRVILPPLSEERRRVLVKQAKSEAENGKISIRNVRKETNEALRKLIKEGVPEDDVKKAETKVQNLTDKYIKQIDDLLELKEKDIMTV